LPSTDLTTRKMLVTIALIRSEDQHAYRKK
jgi:hypothetical protein